MTHERKAYSLLHSLGTRPLAIPMRWQRFGNLSRSSPKAETGHIESFLCKSIFSTLTWLGRDASRSTKRARLVKLLQCSPRAEAHDMALVAHKTSFPHWHCRAKTFGVPRRSQRLLGGCLFMVWKGGGVGANAAEGGEGLRGVICEEHLVSFRTNTLCSYFFLLWHEESRLCLGVADWYLSRWGVCLSEHLFFNSLTPAWWSIDIPTKNRLFTTEVSK